MPAHLSQNVSLDFDKLPLRTVIERLKTQYGLDARLDTEGGKEARVSAETPITIHVRDISLRSALGLMFRDYALDFSVDSGTLLIGRASYIEKGRILAAYEVGDLTANRDNPRGVAPQDLAAVVRDYCRPTTWDDVGGAGTVECFAAGKVRLLVSGQSYDAHREIGGLLTTLRTVCKEAAAHPVFMAGVRCFNSPAEKAAYEKINRAFTKRLSISADREPLSAFASRLGRLSGVNIVLDRHDLREGGISEEMPVTMAAEGP